MKLADLYKFAYAVNSAMKDAFGDDAPDYHVDIRLDKDDFFALDKEMYDAVNGNGGGDGFKHASVVNVAVKNVSFKISEK